MQTVMLRLDALIRRRRRLVLAAWALIVVAALPLAARQSEHLTGGGFDVPGSQSVAVQESVTRDFDNAQATTLAAVLVPREGAGGVELRCGARRGSTPPRTRRRTRRWHPRRARRRCASSTPTARGR